MAHITILNPILALAIRAIDNYLLYLSAIGSYLLYLTHRYNYIGYIYGDSLQVYTPTGLIYTLARHTA